MDLCKAFNCIDHELLIHYAYVSNKLFTFKNIKITKILQIVKICPCVTSLSIRFTSVITFYETTAWMILYEKYN